MIHALNWGLILYTTANALPPETPIEVFSMRPMRLKELMQRIRNVLDEQQVVHLEWNKKFMICPVPENGSVLLGWKVVPQEEVESFRREIIERRREANRRRVPRRRRKGLQMEVLGENRKMETEGSC